MANKKKTTKEFVKTNSLDNTVDRHNENARAASALEQNTPRIKTDNL
ncbi:hypothetical protein LCM10_04205 [Rossellomorea aquimaris]|nr:hypothetical protein [Rossellomorea aquimaris]MCA1054179.1 hypothetical protein [Rossellomorea aquimaris]